MANSRPIALDDVFTISEVDPFFSGNVLVNDSDPEGSRMFLRSFGGERVGAKESLFQQTIVEGEYGTFTVMPNGQVYYEIDRTNDAVRNLRAGETLTEKLTYKISDGQGGTDVGTFELDIAGSETRIAHIDFEDIAPGSMVPDGYEGFDWGEGWIVDTDGGGEVAPDAHVAQPTELVSMIRLENGADFDLVEIILNSDTDTMNPITVRAFNDGVPHPFYGASYGAGIEPSLMDLQWEGIDAIEITYSTLGMWIDEIVAVIPNG